MTFQNMMHILDFSRKYASFFFFISADMKPERHLVCNAETSVFSLRINLPEELS